MHPLELYECDNSGIYKRMDYPACSCGDTVSNVCQKGVLRAHDWHRGTNKKCIEKPVWRNWQTQRTQNPPGSKPLQVRFLSPALLRSE